MRWRAFFIGIIAHRLVFNQLRTLAGLSADVSDDRLSPLIDVDMFDPDVLITAVTQAAKGLNVPRVRPQETRRSRCKRSHPPLAASATSEPGEN